MLFFAESNQEYTSITFNCGCIAYFYCVSFYEKYKTTITNHTDSLRLFREVFPLKPEYKPKFNLFQMMQSSATKQFFFVTLLKLHLPSD